LEWQPGGERSGRNQPASKLKSNSGQVQGRWHRHNQPIVPKALYRARSVSEGISASTRILASIPSHTIRARWASCALAAAKFLTRASKSAGTNTPVHRCVDASIPQIFATRIRRLGFESERWIQGDDLSRDRPGTGNPSCPKRK
jgi:hypothetical protein